MLKFEEWLKLRQKEQDFAYANGLNNGDPETNGEYLCVDYFLNQGLNTFLDIGANKGIFTTRILNKFPDVNVHSFEPNPVHLHDFQSLACQFKSLTFHPTAISDIVGTHKFHCHPNFTKHQALRNVA